jgi:anti-anti-sigma factor
MCLLTIDKRALPNGVLVVAVHGEIDLLTAGRLRKHLSGTIHSRDTKAVVLDTSEVTFLGAAGITVLLAARCEAEHNHIPFHVVATNRTVLRPLSVCGVDTTLSCHRNLFEALDELSHSSPIT